MERKDISPTSRRSSDSSTTRVDSNENNPDKLSLKQRYFRFIATWKGTATLCITASGFTLLLNLIVLIWALAAKPKEDGFVVVYTGSSAKCKHIDLGIRLVVNILSTLILVSSNRCSQFLCAPTREDVDAYHARGQWLDIGVRSFRNFKAVRGWRMVVTVLLILTSMPVHVLYNSVQVVTYAVRDYVAVTVDPSFSRGIPWDFSRHLPQLNNSQTTVLDTIARTLEQNSAQGTLIPLDVNRCQSIYSSQFQSRWGNLVAVSPILNTTRVNGEIQTTVAALTEAWVASPAVKGNYQWWNATQFADDSDNIHHPATGADLYAWASNCALDDQTTCTSPDTYTKVAINACYVQETPEQSTLSFSIGFLSFTIGANLLKVFTLLFVIKKDGFRPLSTTGEAIGSFLAQPDIHTAGMGPVSVQEVRAGPISPTWHGFAFNANRRLRLYKAATKVRWWLGVLSCLVPFLTGLVCLYWATAWPTIPSTGNPHTVFTGVGSFETPAVYRVSSTFTGTALAVNAIQIALAWSYLAANDLLTSMVASREYQRYAAVRKAVRVARPEGQQRDTYFLSLPYKYALPLITLWTLLHWQISIELELVRVQVYNADGSLDKARGYQGMVISSYWFAGIISGVFLIFVGIMAFSLLRYPCGMPLTRANSLLISAACHRGPDEGEEAAVLPVQYGVLPGVMNDGFECVGFSSKHVEPVVAGRRYSSYVDIDVKMSVEDGEKDVP